MCNSRLQTDDLVHMITSISEKKAKVEGNLRLEALLKSTHKWLDDELKEKQLSRKRKCMEMRVYCKKSKSDNYVEMDVDGEGDNLASEMSLLSVLSNLRSNHSV